MRRADDYSGDLFPRQRVMWRPASQPGHDAQYWAAALLAARDATRRAECLRNVVACLCSLSSGRRDNE